MQEIWKDIVGYEGKYQVSNLGNVKSLSYGPCNISNRSEKNLKLSINSSGYYKIELYKNKRSKVFYVHRLVADAFIPNPENKPQINHIDGNKLNNAVTNLEWTTISENQIHAIKQGLRKSSPMLGKIGGLNHNSKPILQYDLNGNFVRKWNSIAEASRYYGCNRNTISNALLGYRKTGMGYIWKYDNSIPD